MIRGVYLDNSMIAKPSEKAVSAMLSFFTERWGTPLAPHQMGQELFPAIEESLQNIYAFLGAHEDDKFVYTSSGAEAVNHAILSTYFDITRGTGKNHFITSRAEEASALMSISRLEQLGCVGRLVSPDHNGQVTAQIIADSITPRTALVSLSWANGLTGVINPVNDIAKLCKERGIRLHLDATHVLGKIFFDLQELEADLISFDGSHLHAPQGAAGLYIKRNIPISSFIAGGLEQAGLRAGNMNVPGLVGLGKAVAECRDSLDFICTETARLRDKLEGGIAAGYPEALLFFRNQERLPHCSTIAFPGLANEALLYALNRKNVFACIGGGSFQQIALVLNASGVPESIAQTAISFSLSRYTTEEEIDRAIEIIIDCAKRLRKTSQALI